MQRIVKYDPAQQSSAAEVAAAGNELVVAKVPQGYATNINLRLVRGVELGRIALPRGCRPRKGAPRRDTKMVDLPAELVEKLKEADQAVVAWLAADEANVQQFLREPAVALRRAGVELTRAEQKAIARSHREVREATVVAPGVKVGKLSAVALPKGKVGQIRPGVGKPDNGEKVAGCVEEE